MPTCTHIRTIAVIQVVTAALSAACQSGLPDSGPGGLVYSRDRDPVSAERMPGLDEVYEHPLLGVTDEGGKYPIADIMDAPGGGRYAVEESVTFDERGAAIGASGIVVHDYRTLTDNERQRLESMKTGVVQPHSREKMGDALLDTLAGLDANRLL